MPEPMTVAMEVRVAIGSTRHSRYTGSGDDEEGMRVSGGEVEGGDGFGGNGGEKLAGMTGGGAAGGVGEGRCRSDTPMA